MDLYCRASHQESLMLPGQGMHQQMSLGPSQPCWSCVLPSCRTHLCSSPVCPEMMEQPQTRSCPCPGCHSPARLQGTEPWGSASLAGALCPHTTPLQGSPCSQTQPLARHRSQGWAGDRHWVRLCPNSQPKPSHSHLQLWVLRGDLGEQQGCGTRSFPGI